MDEQRKEPGLLRPYINRLSHITVNVSDLERSRRFWEAVAPLVAVTRTNGPRQAFASLGIASGQFDGYRMIHPHDRFLPGSEKPGMGVHLVQWLTPEPVGVPYEHIAHLGWYRAAIVTRDIDAAFEKFVEAGGRPYGAPSRNEVGFKRPNHRIFGGRDPDGVTLEWVPGLSDRPAVGSDFLLHMNGNVGSLESSRRFMTEVLGLDHCRHVGPTPPSKDGGSLGFDVGTLEWEASMMCAHNNQANWIDLIKWRKPASPGPAYRVANHLGVVRLAIEVDDIEGAAKIVCDVAAAWHLTIGGELEAWNLGDAGMQRTFVFHTEDGLGFELVERSRFRTEM